MLKIVVVTVADNLKNNEYKKILKEEYDQLLYLNFLIFN